MEDGSGGESDEDSDEDLTGEYRGAVLVRSNGQKGLATTNRTNNGRIGGSWKKALGDFDVRMNGATTVNGAKGDTEATDASFASAGIDFDDGIDWRSSIAANYSIDDGEFDGQDFSIGRTMDWGGDLSFFYNFDREERRVVGIDLVYINECILVDSQILRRRSVIDDAESAIELSVSVEFGNFDGPSGRRCR